jgi:hypothetical protein
MTYLIKWFEPTRELEYSKHVEADSKKEALKKMKGKVKYVTAIYLKLN